MLAKNLTDLRKEKRLTQKAIAKAIGVSRSTYADYESGKSEPASSVLLKIAKLFQVKTDDLLGDLVAMPLFRQSKSTARVLNTDVRVLPITVDTRNRENIQYVPVAALAGYVSEHNQPEFIEQLPYFSLPKISDGTYRAFDIQGDSMPPIRDGYVLIGRFVQHEQDLKNGNRYVLITKSGGIVFKKVIWDRIKHQRLILMSDNPEFQSYSVELDDVMEAWEMVAFVGYPAVYEDATHLLNERLQMIEAKIDRLIPQP